MKPVKQAALVAVSLPFLALAAVVGFELLRALPSDADLLANFTRHEKAFEQLKEMLAKEPPEIIGIAGNQVILEYTWNRVDPAKTRMSSRQFSAYRSVMRENGIQRAWRYERETCFAAGFSGWGFASKGPRLAYVHRETTPTNLLASIDVFQRHGKRRTVAYRPVSSNWFVRLSW